MSDEIASENPREVLFGFFETAIALHYLIPKSAHVELHVGDSRWRVDFLEKLFDDEIVNEFRRWMIKWAQSGPRKDDAFRSAMQSELAEIIRQQEAITPKSASILLAAEQMKLRPEPTALIHRAVLIAAVSAFESLISALTRAFLVKNPLKAPIQEKEFSLAELITLGDLKKVIEVATMRRVEVILRGGLSSWAKWFAEQGIDFENLCIDWPSVIEVFERRHAYVHTQGRVNVAYSARIKGSEPVGSHLPLDEGYLTTALGHIVCLGGLVGAKFWPKIDPEIPPLASAGLPVLYFDELMDLGQWSTIEKMANLLKNENLALDVKLQLRCYEWLAIKKLHGKARIERAVRSWDTSALRAEYVFGKAALLEDFDGMRECISKSQELNEPWLRKIEDRSEVIYQSAVREFVADLLSDPRARSSEERSQQDG